MLELAAGLSPRGIELAARGKVYVGTDLPDIADEVFPVIEEIAERENIPGKQLHLQAVNIFDEKQLQNAAAYFEGKPFAVCNEGLLMYFNREEKAKAAKNIRKLLLQTASAWITTDLAFHEIMLKMMNPEEAEEPMKKIINDRVNRIKSLTERNIMENRFSSESEAIQFYKNCGFEIQDYPMYDENYELSTLQLLPEESRTTMAKRLANMKVWVLKAAG